MTFRRTSAMVLVAALLALSALPEPAHAQSRAEVLSLEREVAALEHTADTLADREVVQLARLARAQRFHRCVHEAPRTEHPTSIELRCRYQAAGPVARAAPGPSATTRTLVAASAAALIPVLNVAFAFDRDDGNYDDRAFQMDKAAHFGIAYSLNATCEKFGVNRWLCAGFTSAGGVAYEYSQGHVSGLDIGANVLGAGSQALASYAIDRWWHSP